MPAHTLDSEESMLSKDRSASDCLETRVHRRGFRFYVQAVLKRLRVGPRANRELRHLA